MKIKTRHLSFQKVIALPRPKRQKPQKPWWILRQLINLISLPDLWATRFHFTTENMEKAGNGPCLILMNHSSFIDLEIAHHIFRRKPFCVVSTTDGSVGKAWLMRKLGCIPTRKYVTDVRLIMDMLYTVKTLKTSVLMFPEAGYSFEGRTTTLPRKLGTLVKKMNVPLITVITDGAYLRQPLYNNLRKRKVTVSAKVSCLLSQAEIEQADVKEIDELIDNAFSFDAFKSQQEKDIIINEPHRAEGLERVLYKCPACHSERTTVGKESHLICKHCGKKYFLSPTGQINAEDGNTEFQHIPDWYDWQRQSVRNEIIKGQYCLNTSVKIGLMIDYKALYIIGNGTLHHDLDGFRLLSNDGALDYKQSPTASYGLNSDFYWYEMDDIICIGDNQCLYYCFLQNENVAVKTRLAAEELYKIKQNKKQ